MTLVYILFLSLSLSYTNHRKINHSASKEENKYIYIYIYSVKKKTLKERIMILYWSKNKICRSEKGFQCKVCIKTKKTDRKKNLAAQVCRQRSQNVEPKKNTTKREREENEDKQIIFLTTRVDTMTADKPFSPSFFTTIRTQTFSIFNFYTHNNQKTWVFFLPLMHVRISLRRTRI